MKNTVIITAADQTGAVIGRSPSNPEIGWIRLTQTRTVIGENGWLRPMRLSAFIRGEIDALLDMEFEQGQELPGRILIRESTEPFNKQHPDKNLKVAGDTGIVCCYYGAPIYRETFFTTNAELQDSLIPHTNSEEIKAEQYRLKTESISLSELMNTKPDREEAYNNESVEVEL
jgi:hypothetical protein